MNKNKMIIVVFSLIILGCIGYGVYYELVENGPNNEKTMKANEINYEKEKVDFSNVDETLVNLDTIRDAYNITKAGVYHFKGILNGYIKVNVNANVQIILDNVKITNNSGPCLYIESVKNIYIELVGENTLTDGNNYIGFDDVNGCIYSKDDLIIYGGGTLKINGNFEDGIVSKDNLIIESGTYNISSKDDGIRGTDSVVITGGVFTINAKGDGIKSTNEKDDTKGNILIQNGTFSIISSGDAIQAIKNIELDNGEFTITTGGGAKDVSLYRSNEGNSNKSTTSSKGIKADGDILIKNGIYNISSYDDSLHSDNALQIDNGVFIISTSDDAIHGDNSVLINNGAIDVTSSYEGMEANNITINSGNIKLVARDDGINAGGGVDSSGFGRGGRTTIDSTSSVNKLTINGGYIYVNATGDGLDTNGSIFLNGGEVLVDGPIDNRNSAIDYDREFQINGGILIAAGSSGMMQNATSSNVGTVLIFFSSTISAGTDVSIGDILYTPSKNFNCILISSAKLEVGKTYEVKLNGNIYTTETLLKNVNCIGSRNSVNGIEKNGGQGRW